MRPDNTRFLIQAAHQRSQATRQRAIQALRDLAAAGDPITFQTIARTAAECSPTPAVKARASSPPSAVVIAPTAPARRWA